MRLIRTFVPLQSVRHRSRAEQCAAAAHEPVCPDQPGGGALSLHHLHADRSQVSSLIGISPAVRHRGYRLLTCSFSNYNAVDTASAVAIALMTFGTMYPMSVYSGKVLLQVRTSHNDTPDGVAFRCLSHPS